MRKIKIVADSSCDMFSLKSCEFASAPMKIITDGREFVDDEKLDVVEMVEFLDQYKGKSKSSCPNTSDWLEAFAGADDIFCITITSGLSGSYNSASAAKQIYVNDHEGSRVFVIDTLSAGPEISLIIEMIEEYVNNDCNLISREQLHIKEGMLTDKVVVNLSNGPYCIMYCFILF